MSTNRVYLLTQCGEILARIIFFLSMYLRFPKKLMNHSYHKQHCLCIREPPKHDYVVHEWSLSMWFLKIYCEIWVTVHENALATLKERLLPHCDLRESREQVKSTEQLTTAKREKRGEIVAKLARSGWEITPSRWPTFISCCATLTLLQVRCASVVKESLSRAAGGIGAPRTHLLFGRNRQISFSGKKTYIIFLVLPLHRLCWE